jgi:hypothetical protein
MRSVSPSGGCAQRARAADALNEPKSHGRERSAVEQSGCRLAPARRSDGATCGGAVAEVLRTFQFDTVLGRIGLDQKGDLTGSDT